MRAGHAVLEACRVATLVDDETDEFRPQVRNRGRELHGAIAHAGTTGTTRHRALPTHIGAVDAVEQLPVALVVDTDRVEQILHRFTGAEGEARTLIAFEIPAVGIRNDNAERAAACDCLLSI